MRFTPASPITHVMLLFFQSATIPLFMSNKDVAAEAVSAFPSSGSLFFILVSGADAVSTLAGHRQWENLGLCDSHTGNSPQTGGKIKEKAGEIRILSTECFFMMCQESSWHFPQGKCP